MALKPSGDVSFFVDDHGWYRSKWDRKVIARVTALAPAGERSLRGHVREISCGRRRRGAGDARIISRAQASREPVGPLGEHPKERLLLTFVQLPPEPVQKFRFVDQ